MSIINWLSLLVSEITSDKDTGLSPRFYVVIVCYVRIQTSDYFMYDLRGSSPCGVCRCVSYRAVLCSLY